MAPTFKAVADDYLRKIKLDVAHSTWLSYKDSLNRYWLPVFGPCHIDRIDYAALIHAWDGIHWQSKKTAKNNLIPLHGVFAYAWERNLIDSNPANRIRIRKMPRPRVDPFSYEEKETILERLRVDHEPMAHLFFLTNFETGARTGELLALTWSDFDGRGFTITKTMTRRRIKASTKTGHDRYTFATRRLRQALADHGPGRPADNLFLNTHGTPMLDADWLNVRWRAALKTEGICYRRAYNCRHTYATLGLMAGLDPPLLAQQLGHSLEIFHRNYARWMPRAQDEQAILRMEAFWRDGPDKPPA